MKKFFNEGNIYLVASIVMSIIIVAQAVVIFSAIYVTFIMK